MSNRGRLRSLLPSWLRVLLATALVLAVFMVANAAYLLLNRLTDALDWTFFAVGETSLPKLFQAMVLTHTGVGLVLAVLMIAFAVTHLPKVWARRHTASIVTGALYVTVGLALTLTGLFVLTAAASRDNRWAWWTHVISAALVVGGYVAHRIVSYVRPHRRQFGRFAASVGACLLVLVVAHAFTKRDVDLTPEAQAAFDLGLNTGPGSGAREISRFTADRFVPAAFVPPESPFFPSPATTTSGTFLPSRILTRGEQELRDIIRNEASTKGFVTETLIGATTCERCHQDIVAQWAVSAHRFASFNNPFYEATVNDMRRHASQPNSWIDQHAATFAVPEDGVGRVKSKWCSGCHDPALMLAGAMDGEVDRTSAEAQAGLTCLACHAIDRIHNRTGNGNYNIADEQEDPYLYATASSGSIRAFLHDASVKAKPTVHKRQMLNPTFRESEFCATCHKVSLTEPVNNYRWLRGQNEFDNWDDSGVSLNAARTFYLPPTKRRCQDCHMPLEPADLGDVSAKDGQVRSHRFLAVNTALPFVRGDEETVSRTEAFLRDGKLRLDIFALNRPQSRTPVMAIDRTESTVAPGDRITLDVVVRNEGVGHTFPGGTNDSNEGWLELTVFDDAGNVIAQSGAIDSAGHLDPMAHVYKAVILDRNGNQIQRRNAQDIHVTVFANVINPGTADLAHYTFVVPRTARPTTLRVRARLLWRKFDRPYTEFAYRTNPEGFLAFDGVPDLPISEIAAHEVTIKVDRAASIADKRAADPDQWVRYNDYGIGLLLEGNTRMARVAFGRVAELQPGKIDGPLNLARVALRDGNLGLAYDHLSRTEEIGPGDARSAWVWGQVLQEDGQYEAAIAAYQRVLDEFPRDRATWRSLGRTYYLDQQFERAIEALDEVLDIDPEDRVAHYHQMLAYRALGETAEAAVAEAAYEYYRIDESAQAITRDFRQRNPGANLMAQPIRTHELTIASNALATRR